MMTEWKGTQIVRGSLLISVLSFRGFRYRVPWLRVPMSVVSGTGTPEKWLILYAFSPYKALKALIKLYKSVLKRNEQGITLLYK